MPWSSSPSSVVYASGAGGSSLFAPITMSDRRFISLWSIMLIFVSWSFSIALVGGDNPGPPTDCTVGGRFGLPDDEAGPGSFARVAFRSNDDESGNYGPGTVYHATSKTEGLKNPGMSKLPSWKFSNLHSA